MRIGFAASILAGIAVLSAASSAQIVQLGAPGVVSERFKNVPARPSPRRSDGRISLGPYPGEIGMWLPYNGVGERVISPDTLTTPASAQFLDKSQIVEVPFQRWSKELYLYRRVNQFEPHSR